MKKQKREERGNNKKNKPFLKEKGITLVALVVTIILLIIISGISINLTLGENGIFNKAKKAKEEYEVATKREELMLQKAELQLENNGKITVQQ